MASKTLTLPKPPFKTIPKELEHFRPQPISINDEFSAIQKSEYLRLQRAIGFGEQPRLYMPHTQIFDILSGCCTLYDFNAICRWMNKIYGETKVVKVAGSRANRDLTHFNHHLWTFYPLRAADVQVNLVPAGYTKRDGWEKAVKPYTRTIPIPVLHNVEKVMNRFPSANFLVADSANLTVERFLDPFMIVSVNGSVYGIGCWDEPGFGEWPGAIAKKAVSSKAKTKRKKS